MLFSTKITTAPLVGDVLLNTNVQDNIQSLLRDNRPAYVGASHIHLIYIILLSTSDNRAVHTSTAFG